MHKNTQDQLPLPAPWFSLEVRDTPDADISVLGIPFDGAVSWRKGAAKAPEHIRKLSPWIDPVTQDRVSLKHITLRDYGDVETEGDWELVSANCREGATRALQHPFAVFLGGDHSVTIPLVTAFSQVVKGPVGIIHFDAHADLCDVFDGTKWSHACTERRVSELPNVDPSHMAFVGVRALLHTSAHPRRRVRLSKADVGCAEEDRRHQSLASCSYKLLRLH